MENVQASHYLSVQSELGEGPLWHPVEKRLYWVDIEVGKIFRYSPATETQESFTVGTSVGALGFRSNGGLVLATGKGFAFWDSFNQSLKILADPIAGKQDIRLNDGKVGPSGHFWAGSLDLKGEGAFYRLDPDCNCHTILKHITISNGLAWSPDNTRLYYTDSGDHTIYTFDFDFLKRTIQNQQIFIQLPTDNSEGVPDGLTIDAEGCIWSARWDGAKVVRYSPIGEAILEVNLPVSRVTACTFGGENLDDLFITTAAMGLTAEQRARQPYAGDIFVYKTNTKGLETPFFAG